MRILYAGRSLTEPLGGGELSARALLWTVGRSHEVRVVGAASRAARRSLAPGFDLFDHAVPAALGSPKRPGLTSAERSFRRVIVDHVERFAPEIVILQQPSWLRPSDLPADTVLILFVRSPLCFAAWDPNPVRWRRAAALFFATSRYRKYRPLLGRADLIVTNSAYMRDELLRRRGVRSVAVPPLIISPSVEPSAASSSAADRITFVGLDRWKGGDTAVRLARAMPRRRFLFLAGNRSNAALRVAAERLENVELVDWTPDVHAQLRRTRLLIVPSRWAEPFGRVAVEAASLGVPTIATAIGGLPESVGDGGVLLPPGSGLTRWREAIERLDDPHRFEQLAAAAVVQSQRFSSKRTLEQLRTALREHAAVDLALVEGSPSEFAAWSESLKSPDEQSMRGREGSA